MKFILYIKKEGINMKHGKKYLLPALLALGLSITGTNSQFIKECNTGVTKAAETDFVIDDNKILTAYNGTDTDIVIPDGITGIGDRVFYNYTKLNSIIIPDSVITIGEKTFWNCKNLAEITLPDNITEIGAGTFKDCRSLTKVIIPGNVKTIEQALFSDCRNLEEVVIPDGVTTIKPAAFSGCHSLTKARLPENLVTIEDSAFSGCKSLTKVSIPGNVKSIGHFVFSNCQNLKEINIPAKTEIIGDSAFSGCKNLTSVIVKQNNKKYQSEDGVLFKKVKNGLELMLYPANKKGTVYKIPGKTQKIDNGAFTENKKLKELVLSGNMKNINYQNSLFFGINNLKTLKINMKKGTKINISFIIDEDSGFGSLMPEAVQKNKNIAKITMPKEKENNDDTIDYPLAYKLKGTIKANKKGKAEIVFNRTTFQNKKTSDKEVKQQKIKLKTTLEITVK